MISLDVLRGVAIVLVLLHHPIDIKADLGAIRAPAALLHRFGWTGVDLFFVLSGFLIGGLIFREIKRTGRFDLRQFLIRRAFKLWPAYLLLVLWSAIKYLRHGASLRDTALLYWPNLLHLQNYVANDRIGHSWSLAVEEHFYLLLSLFVAAVVGLRPELLRKRFLTLSLILVVVVGAFRVVHAVASPYALGTHYTPTHLRIDSLLFGVMIAHVATFRDVLWARLLSSPARMGALGFCLVAPMAIWERESVFAHSVGYTFLYLGYGAIVIAALGLQSKYATRRRRSASLEAVRWTLLRLANVGVFSYGIYLWHTDFAQQPIWFHLLPRLSGLPGSVQWITSMSLYLSAAILVGAVMTTLVEIPALKIRDRWFPRTRPAGRIEPNALANVDGRPVPQGAVDGAFALSA